MRKFPDRENGIRPQKPKKAGPKHEETKKKEGKSILTKS
jgi:hypothetical protein